MKKSSIKILIVLVIIVVFFFVYPHLEFYHNNKLYKFTYSDDFSEWEQNMCFDESYSYNESRDISIYSWEVKEFLFFRAFILEYKEGNVCNSEYVLEESYIKHFLKDAEIKENIKQIDIEKIIEGKTAIVGNHKYSGNDYETSISYVLDEKHEVLFVFYVDDMVGYK